MSAVVGVRSALPSHVHRQEDITAQLGEVVLGRHAERSEKVALLRRLHGAAGVRTRHFVLPLGAYADLGGFGGANDVFIDEGVRLGEQAINHALADAGLAPADVDLLMTTSVTGIAAPSLDARLVGRLGLRPDVKRVPIFGLGCVAGAAGIARIHDYLQGHPDGVAVLLSVELCSLTFQRDDDSTANLVASGLFGDGAAAVVLAGEQRAAALGLERAPRVVATRSRFYPDTERVMGWDIGASGFRIVLAATVADVVRDHLGDDVEAFLAGHDLKIADIDTWVAHPGGPKVIDAIIRALGLPPDALDVTRHSLAELGNLSSSSVLHVLERTLADRRPTPGAPGVLMAMGPGFCAELVLLRW
ncbi:MAG TPA: 3-oxoacyl-[acyl-carrier-protein] synthase III C-terminal domain-containing protein [Kineosporiaceae bacterium]|nr:3-oxoacyl-[acyl-carrier-protein] synthase III C-terminal domain-containing protein [Kineosporiaceae bacterium]